MRVGIVVPVLNNFSQALDFISSARSQEHELVFLIQPQYREKVALAKAWNTGIRQAWDRSCDCVIVSNDDVLFAPDTIDKWVAESQQLPQDVVLTVPSDASKYFEDPYDIVESRGKTFELTFEAEMDFSCFMVRPGFQKLCGWFDENFYPCWWEDIDMDYRISLLGIRWLRVHAPFIHLGHQTTNRLGRSASAALSEAYFVQKWGSLNRFEPQSFKTPYNDSEMSPTDWIEGYMEGYVLPRRPIRVVARRAFAYLKRRLLNGK